MTLKIEKIESQLYILLEDKTVKSRNKQISVLQGFDFDAASIPRIFWSIIGSPFTGTYTVPAMIHDALYASNRLPRKECDEIFLDLMKQYKVSYFKRYSMYWSVRVGGRGSYNDTDLERVNRYKSLCFVKEGIDALS